jgi:precorrin-2 dehydrogenase / sirohydrochlorin ferrochelatase
VSVPLLVALKLDGCRVLVVGGGEIATHRVQTVLPTGATVEVISPEVSADLASLAESNALAWTARPFEPEDVDGAALVLSAADDPTVGRAVAAACRAAGVLVNVADVPAQCDLYFPALHRDGPLQVAVSTSGHGPGLAAVLRDLLAKALPERASQAIVRFGALRRAVRAASPQQEASSDRMSWLRAFVDEQGVDALAALNDETIATAVSRFVRDTE